MMVRRSYKLNVEIQRLHRQVLVLEQTRRDLLARLAIVRDCQDRRCSLCARCLAAAEGRTV